MAGLMRVNHTGEVCAQALYQGQALTAKLPTVREEMQQAAAEEVDHLVWCEERLRELDSKPSFLNPAWYGLSFALGAVAGAIGDKVSLGFVAATEERVCKSPAGPPEIAARRRPQVPADPAEDAGRRAAPRRQGAGGRRHRFSAAGEGCHDRGVQADDPQQLPDLTPAAITLPQQAAGANSSIS